ncbi:MAG: polysaccharide deacetylase family protein [Agriterribacter sp.]
MIRIETTTNCYAEKQYVFHLIFSEFLGMDHSIAVNDALADKIILTTVNDAILQFPDIFFATAAKNWLSKESLPPAIVQSFNIADSQVEFKLPFSDIPVLYGLPSIRQENRTNINCGIDIFGSVFFMLSRYEELVVPERDKSDRFPAKSSIAYKNNFLLRPIVDEYIELLWQMLKQLVPDFNRKKRQSKTVLTCDVDWPFNPDNQTFSRLAKTVVSKIVKTKDIKGAYNSFVEFINVKRNGWKADSFNTFNYLMTLAEQHGIQMVFYFICDHSAGAIDGNYHINDPLIEGLMKEIHHRGHSIGVHTSYNTYLDASQTKKEVDILKDTLRKLNISQNEVGVRQHFLRYRTSETIAHLNAAGLDHDSTLSFADHAGFRTGTCNAYPMYDLNHRTMLHIKERPLIAMEHSVISKENMGLGYSDAAFTLMKDLKAKCYQYNGDFIVLWHNSFFKNAGDKKLLEATLAF